MKVLVTGAGALLGQGIIRALRRSTLDAQIVTIDPNPLSAGLYWVDKGYLVPLAKDETYLDRMCELLARERPDAVLVGTDVELGILAEAREGLESTYGTNVVVSSPRVVAIADDKYETYRFLRSAGFHHPATALPEDLPEWLGTVDYPLVVKPRVGARSVGVHLVHDRQQLDAAIASLDAPVIQECVADRSREYTASGLVFDGACVASIVMRRDLRDGNTYRAFVTDDEALNQSVRAMAEALGAYGPVNFQFRLDGDRVKVFEINARFSGTTPLRALAGFNEVEMCLRHVVLGEPIRQPTVEPMTILRHWSETVVRPQELLGS